jgi:uncharacterized protein YqiB (DUF1249 family)
MTVKQKPLRDVRYFECAERPVVGGAFPNYTSDIYQLPKEAIALGQRIGMKCEELEISIGHADHLYVCFSPALPPGAIELTHYAVEPWHRFVVCGLPTSFNHHTLEQKMQEVTTATFAALSMLIPASNEQLQSLKNAVDSAGASLRITIREKSTKKFHVRVEQIVPVHPNPTEVYVSVTNLLTQVRKESKVAEVKLYDEAPSLVDRIAISGDTLKIRPRKSFRANLITERYTVPIQLNLRELGVL